MPGKGIAHPACLMKKQVTRPAESAISGELVAAYLSTHYRVRLPAPPALKSVAGASFASGRGRTFDLCIDQHSAPLSQLFAVSDYRCAAFITASNPFSVPHGVEENLAACARLRDELLRRSFGSQQILDGEGFDPTGAWPGERSFLVLGLDLETSTLLGREFGQNALVWAGEDAIPRLVLLR
jgi:hypothetical protein